MIKHMSGTLIFSLINTPIKYMISYYINYYFLSIFLCCVHIQLSFFFIANENFKHNRTLMRMFYSIFLSNRSKILVNILILIQTIKQFLVGLHN